MQFVVHEAHVSRAAFSEFTSRTRNRNRNHRIAVVNGIE